MFSLPPPRNLGAKGNGEARRVSFLSRNGFQIIHRVERSGNKHSPSPFQRPVISGQEFNSNSCTSNLLTVFRWISVLFKRFHIQNCTERVDLSYDYNLPGHGWRRRLTQLNLNFQLNLNQKPILTEQFLLNIPID